MPLKTKAIKQAAADPFTVVPNNLAIKKQDAANISFLSCNKIVETIKKESGNSGVSREC